MFNKTQDASSVSVGVTTLIGLGVTAAQAVTAGITWYSDQDDATLGLFVGALTTLIVTLGGRFKQADTQIKTSGLLAASGSAGDDDMIDDHDDRVVAGL